MTPLRREILLKTFKLSDLLIMACSFAMATWAAFYRIETISFDEFLAMRVKVENFAIFLGFLLLWHIIFVARPQNSGKNNSSGFERLRRRLDILILNKSLCSTRFALRLSPQTSSAALLTPNAAQF